MGVVILPVMAAGVAAMLTRKLPTAFALVVLGVVIAFVASAPLTGENSVLDTVLQEGARPRGHDDRDPARLLAGAAPGRDRHRGDAGAQDRGVRR
ncbi:hypothetical protein ACFQVA_40090 [Actinomadura keratinilytica]